MNIPTTNIHAKGRRASTTALALSLAVLTAGVALGGVPLNNLQGTGGIAFNPLAYTAGLPWEGAGTSNFNAFVSKPQVGTWYVNLHDAEIDWWAASAALTVGQRLELSYGYGYVDAHRYGDNAIDTHNLGAKLRILDENAFDTAWVPAIAIGGVWKHTDSETVRALGLRDNGADVYAVASKLITQTPIPVLLSAGLLVSDEVVNGVVGHNDYGVAGFGNIDILPAENIALGFEYKQGVDVGDGIRNHDYYDAHVAWFVTKGLTLVAAYADTGDKNRFVREGSANKLGVGSALVVSVQYQF